MIMFNDQIDISVPVDPAKRHYYSLLRIAIPGRGPVEGCSLERFLEEGFTVINSYYPETYVDFEIMPRRKQSGYGRLFHLLSLIKVCLPDYGWRVLCMGRASPL